MRSTHICRSINLNYVRRIKLKSFCERSEKTSLYYSKNCVYQPFFKYKICKGENCHIHSPQGPRIGFLTLLVNKNDTILHIHTHTHTQIYTSIRTHTHTHRYTHSHIHTHTHTHTRTHPHTHTHPPTHPHTHARARTDIWFSSNKKIIQSTV